MKNTGNDLLKALGDVGEDLIAENTPGAYQRDTIKNVQQKKRGAVITQKKTVLIAAAAVLLIAALLIPFALMTARRPDGPEDVTTPQSEPGRPAPKLDSIDKIVYYGARAALEQPENDSLRYRIRRARILSEQETPEESELIPLTADDGTGGNDPDPDPAPDYPDPIPSPNDSEAIGRKQVVEVLDLSDTRLRFVITQVYYFEFDVAEGDFLASKIGAGRAKAAVTVNSVNHMITFCDENEERFFSCFADRQRDDDGVWYFEFSSLKYIDGNRILQDGSKDGCGFIVGTAQRQIDCFYTKEIKAGAPLVALTIDDRPSDGGIPVFDVEYYSGKFRYSISDLEEYLNKKAFERPEAQDQTPPDAVPTTPEPQIPTFADPDATLTPVDPDMEGFCYEDERADAFDRQARGEAIVYNVFFFVDSFRDNIYLPEPGDAIAFAAEVLRMYGFDAEGCESACLFDPTANIWKIVFESPNGARLTAYLSYYGAMKQVVAENIGLTPYARPSQPVDPEIKPWMYSGHSCSYSEYDERGYRFDYAAERAAILARRDAGEEGVRCGGFPEPGADQLLYDSDVNLYAQERCGLRGTIYDIRVDLDARVWKIVLLWDEEGLVGGRRTLYVSFDGEGLISVEEGMD